MTIEELEVYIYKKTNHFVAEPVLRAFVELLNEKERNNAAKHDNKRTID